MEGGSGVAVLQEESSTWTVLQQQSCEDRSGLFLWLEQRDHHAGAIDGDMTPNVISSPPPPQI